MYDCESRRHYKLNTHDPTMKTLTAQRNRAFADLCLRMADADLRHGRLVNVGVIVL